MKKIAILFPGPSLRPVGGYKVLYEYTKLLSKKGYYFDLLYPINDFNTESFCSAFIRYIRHRFISFWNWYDFSNLENINHKVLVKLQYHKLNKYSAIFCSAAPQMRNLKKEKITPPILYFIQHYEEWSMKLEDLHDTYRGSNQVNIAVSSWLKEIVENVGKTSCELLTNAIDYNKFFLETKIKFRNPRKILFFYASNKPGMDEGLEALKKLKQYDPEVEVSVFSRFQRSDKIPEWMKYYFNASETLLRKLYNDAGIFLITSEKEGFSLPPAEAMACGACVVAVDSYGNRDFCIHDKTAKVINDRKVEHIVTTIKNLINDNEKRIQIAETGCSFIRKLSWDANLEKLEKILQSVIK